jgi:hypothetical protein
MLLIFGFTLIPNTNYACSTIAEQSTKEACCKEKKHSTSEHKNCTGNCGNKTCHCPTLQLTFLKIVAQEIKNFVFDFQNLEQKTSYQEYYRCSGFHTIWQPPKIS